MIDNPGFVRPPAFYIMEFTDDLAGLVIRVRGLDGDAMVQLAHTDATVEQPMAAAPLFAQQVDSWNLTFADGGSVPPSFEGLMKQDTDFIKQVVGTWVRDVLPLPYPSTRPVHADAATAANAATPAAVDETMPFEVDPDEDDAELSALRVFSRAAA